MGEIETQGESRWWRMGAPLLALLVCLFSARLRTDAATEHAAFDSERAESVLRSDPALLFHLTQSVIEAGGTPADWAAEPRLAWPETVNVPQTYTVGQEYLVLWARRLLGDELPLHEFTLRLMALVAALAGMGVYLMGAELTGSARLGLLATVIHATLPAAYRTIGFVLVREDLSLPLYALHLGLALRALRRDTLLAWLLAGLSLGAAMGTWHAGGLLALVELSVLALGALLGFFVAPARSLWALIGLVLVCLVNPALRSKGAYFDLPVLLAASLVLASRLAGRQPWLGLTVTTAFAIRLFVLPSEDMGHVVGLLAAKLLFLGIPPTDPNVLGFETRMMWQGPFQTLTVAGLWGFFLVALLLLPVVVLATMGGRKVRGEGWLCGMLVVGLGLAWMAQRMVVLPALLLPCLLALGAQRSVAVSQRPFGVLGVASLLFFQGLLFAGWVQEPPLPWYSPARALETGRLIDAVAEHVPADEPIAADFLLNPLLLARTGRPMVLQPKWERRAARQRVEEFWGALYAGRPEDLAELLRERFDCRWLAVDRQVLGVMGASLYLAGLPKGAGPPPGSAAMALCGGDGREVPGMRLVWESPPKNGFPGVFRLYRLDP